MLHYGNVITLCYITIMWLHYDTLKLRDKTQVITGKQGKHKCSDMWKKKYGCQMKIFFTNLTLIMH